MEFETLGQVSTDYKTCRILSKFDDCLIETTAQIRVNGTHRHSLEPLMVSEFFKGGGLVEAIHRKFPMLNVRDIEHYLWDRYERGWW